MVDNNFFAGKKKRNMLIALLLIVAVLVSSGLALMSSTGVMTNVFTVGTLDIELWENFNGTLYGPEDGDPPILDNIAPNTPVTKEPYVKNLGNSTAIVYMSVGVPKVSVGGVSEECFSINSLSSDWYNLGLMDSSTENMNYYLFCYTKKLNENESTSPVFKTVSLIKEDEYLKLSSADGIQTTFDASGLVFSKVSDEAVSASTLRTIEYEFIDENKQNEFEKNKSIYIFATSIHSEDTDAEQSVFKKMDITSDGYTVSDYSFEALKTDLGTDKFDVIYYGTTEYMAGIYAINVRDGEKAGVYINNDCQLVKKQDLSNASGFVGYEMPVNAYAIDADVITEENLSLFKELESVDEEHSGIDAQDVKAQGYFTSFSNSYYTKYSDSLNYSSERMNDVFIKLNKTSKTNPSTDTSEIASGSIITLNDGDVSLFLYGSDPLYSNDASASIIVLAINVKGTQAFKYRGVETELDDGLYVLSYTNSDKNYNYSFDCIKEINGTLDLSDLSSYESVTVENHHTIDESIKYYKVDEYIDANREDYYFYARWAKSSAAANGKYEFDKETQEENVTYWYNTSFGENPLVIISNGTNTVNFNEDEVQFSSGMWVMLGEFLITENGITKNKYYISDYVVATRVQYNPVLSSPQDYSDLIGKTFECGSMPKTLVENSSINIDNGHGYSAYFGYGTNNSAVSYWYEGITIYPLNDDLYAGYRFEKYHPSNTWNDGSISEEDNSYNDEYGYEVGNEYIFKMEPIQWVIYDVTEYGEVLAVSKDIITSSAFNLSYSKTNTSNGTEYYSRYNYSSSDVMHNSASQYIYSDIYKYMNYDGMNSTLGFYESYHLGLSIPYFNSYGMNDRALYRDWSYYNDSWSAKITENSGSTHSAKSEYKYGLPSLDEVEKFKTINSLAASEPTDFAKFMGLINDSETTGYYYWTQDAADIDSLGSTCAVYKTNGTNTSYTEKNVTEVRGIRPTISISYIYAKQLINEDIEQNSQNDASGHFTKISDINLNANQNGIFFFTDRWGTERSTSSVGVSSSFSGTLFSSNSYNYVYANNSTRQYYYIVPYAAYVKDGLTFSMKIPYKLKDGTTKTISYELSEGFWVFNYQNAYDETSLPLSDDYYEIVDYKYPQSITGTKEIYKKLDSGDGLNYSVAGGLSQNKLRMSGTYFLDNYAVNGIKIYDGSSAYSKYVTTVNLDDSSEIQNGTYNIKEYKKNKEEVVATHSADGSVYATEQNIHYVYFNEEQANLAGMQAGYYVYCVFAGSNADYTLSGKYKFNDGQESNKNFYASDLYTSYKNNNSRVQLIYYNSNSDARFLYYLGSSPICNFINEYKMEITGTSDLISSPYEMYINNVKIGCMAYYGVRPNYPVAYTIRNSDTLSCGTYIQMFSDSNDISYRLCYSFTQDVPTSCTDVSFDAAQYALSLLKSNSPPSEDTNYLLLNRDTFDITRLTHSELLSYGNYIKTDDIEYVSLCGYILYANVKNECSISIGGQTYEFTPGYWYGSGEILFNNNLYFFSVTELDGSTLYECIPKLTNYSFEVSTYWTNYGRHHENGTYGTCYYIKANSSEPSDSVCFVVEVYDYDLEKMVLVTQDDCDVENINNMCVYFYKDTPIVSSSSAGGEQTLHHNSWRYTITYGTSLFFSTKDYDNIHNTKFIYSDTSLGVLDNSGSLKQFATNFSNKITKVFDSEERNKISIKYTNIMDLVRASDTRYSEGGVWSEQVCLSDLDWNKLSVACSQVNSDGTTDSIILSAKSTSNAIKTVKTADEKNVFVVNTPTECVISNAIDGVSCESHLTPGLWVATIQDYDNYTLSPQKLTYNVDDRSENAYGIQAESYTPPNAYNFSLNSENYYESQNKNIDYTSSICKVSFNAKGGNMHIKWMQTSESYCDYAAFGELDETLCDSAYMETTDNYRLNLYGRWESEEQDFEYVVGDDCEHFIYIKYRKDGSYTSGNDSLQFKIVMDESDATYSVSNLSGTTTYNPNSNYYKYSSSLSSCENINYNIRGYNINSLVRKNNGGATLWFLNADDTLPIAINSVGDTTFELNGQKYVAADGFYVYENLSTATASSGIYLGTVPSGAGYDFELNEDGYYESKNKGINNTAAVCIVEFNANGGDVLINWIQTSEQHYDYGIFGELDTNLKTGYSVDGDVYRHRLYGQWSDTETQYTYSVGDSNNHFFAIKYRKDGSCEEGNDTLQFKIAMTAPGATYSVKNIGTVMDYTTAVNDYFKKSASISNPQETVFNLYGVNSNSLRRVDNENVTMWYNDKIPNDANAPGTSLVAINSIGTNYYKLAGNSYKVEDGFYVAKVMFFQIGDGQKDNVPVYKITSELSDYAASTLRIESKSWTSLTMTKVEKGNATFYIEPEYINSPEAISHCYIVNRKNGLVVLNGIGLFLNEGVYTCDQQLAECQTSYRLKELDINEYIDVYHQFF